MTTVNLFQYFHFQKNNNHEIMKIIKVYAFLHNFKLDAIFFGCWKKLEGLFHNLDVIFLFLMFEKFACTLSKTRWMKN